MKKNFLTGLIILIPIVLTFLIIQFLVNFLTSPFVGYIGNLFGNSEWFDNLSSHDIAEPLSKLLILLIMPATIISIGFFGRGFFIKHLFLQIDKLAYRIPYINRIYTSIKEAVHAFFEPKSQTFSSVVLVPFPHPSTYCMGFITGEDVSMTTKSKDMVDSSFITVFVPGTPNPTGGFMMVFQKDQLIHVDMKIEDALKFILSCGLISKDLKL